MESAVMTMNRQVVYHHTTLKKRSIRIVLGYPKTGGRFNRHWKGKICERLKISETLFNHLHEFSGNVAVSTLVAEVFQFTDYQIKQLNRIEQFFMYGRTWEEVLEMILEGVI
jgi:hypothetical protein